MSAPDPLLEEVNRLRAEVAALSARVRAFAPYAEDDLLRPPLPPIRDLVKVGGPNIDAWRYWLADVADRDEEGRYRRVLRDPWPLPETENREGYCAGDHIAYWLSGLADYLKTSEAVARHGVTGGRFYEFGGGTGRVYRHFAAQSDAWEVWSSDFRMSSVRWSLAQFPPAVRVFANTSIPGLPLPDAAFDLVTAYSVFTHIDEAETAWLLELRRILRPGGIAYLSVHDEHTWRADERLREMVCGSRGLAPESPLPEGKTVARWREDDPYSCNVLHSEGHLRSVWGRFFEILEIKPGWVGAQSAVICRRAD
jgi:SAM-dependent methyltransferase